MGCNGHQRFTLEAGEGGLCPVHWEPVRSGPIEHSAASYRAIGVSVRPNVAHASVNHSVEFKAADGTYTNQFEGFHGGMKRLIRRQFWQVASRGDQTANANKLQLVCFRGNCALRRVRCTARGWTGSSSCTSHFHHTVRARKCPLLPHHGPDGTEKRPLQRNSRSLPSSDRASGYPWGFASC